MAGEIKRLSAFVLGATGEVGRELTNLLASNENFSRIVLIGRRKIELNAEKFSRVEQAVVDFDKLTDSADVFKGFDVGYCCLGTTRHKAGVDGFVKVDRDYVVESAKLAKEAGCQQFHLVTAQGSNKNSFFLYPKTKGEAEEAVSNVGFERLAIYRPGLLLCDRQESRPTEKIAQVVVGTLDRWGKVSIPTISVAQAMLKNTLKASSKPIEILEHGQIFQMAKN